MAILQLIMIFHPVEYYDVIKIMLETEYHERCHKVLLSDQKET